MFLEKIIIALLMVCQVLVLHAMGYSKPGNVQVISKEKLLEKMSLKIIGFGQGDCLTKKEI